YVLYSIFILIPLALVALLPAVSIVGVRIDTFMLVLIYVVILPLATFLYGEYILLQRPAAFAPPHIPERHPALENIRTLRRIAICLAIVLGTTLALLGYILLYFGNPYGIVSESIMGGLVPPTFPAVWGITAAISVYCTIAYMPYKRIRDGIKQIEIEFADALFVLGRRVSEGRSAEWAFMTTAETMRGSMISEVFAAIVGNLISLRATMQSAIFDEEYGALRDVYSDRVHTTMKLFTESVNRSHEAAGVAIVKLAEHLKELQEVEERIRQGLYDVTSTMRSTALIFAPLIAGVTLALSEVIQKILQSVSIEASRLPEEVGVVSIMKDVGTGMEQSVPPETFMLVIGIYVILMVVILVRFAGGIEYGGDKSQFMYELGQILPFAIIVFSVTTLASRILFRSMV
ncbi:MAG TPA: hypothetical protein HA257_07135, partial [Candidatus Methanoperedenaceae archaeon]|nr:hypothetical protein [Candidatus Methanoperedenaceae archaeon]